MNIKYAIAASLLISLSAFAQKDELKAIKKLDGKEKLTTEENKEYKRLLAEVEPKISGATPEQQAEFYYYKGSFAGVEMMENPALASTNFPIALENLQKVVEIEKNGKKKYTDEIVNQHFPMMKEGAVMIGQKLAEQKNFKAAAPYYEAAYKVDPKDPSNLYNAAAMAVNGQDYPTALQYYLELDKIGYTGEGTAYIARNKATGKLEGFQSAILMNAAITSGKYDTPKTEKIPSVKGEIVKNIALIYNQQGDTEKAKQAFVNARKANPDDVNLIISEADLYLKSNNMEMYKTLINEAVQKNPTNADLFYNLGVVTTPSNKAEAIKHYEKALQLSPNMVNANINLGVLMLEDEKKLVDEMNNLGTSAKEQKRYDELKAKRDAMYRKSLPYFKNAHAAEPDNQYVIEVLAGVYQALEMDAEAKAMKAKKK